MPKDVYGAPVPTPRVAEPSRADENITLRLRETLALIEVRVLDHFIVTAEGTLSLTERGVIYRAMH